jgi:CheY-like chemotaxis protein
MRIVIADDIFTNRLLISEIVKGLGHTIMEAENGQQAIDILRNYAIDLIFMDIEMPVMNGIETTQYIRNSMPFPKNKIPVIALTAHNPKIFFEDFQDVGFDRLLTKPYSIEKVIRLIHEFTKDS